MRLSLRFIILFIAVAVVVFGQGGNGTITGTIIDPAGAAVANATVEAKNAETGVVYSAVSTNAGVYSIPNLPVGIYEVTTTVQGYPPEL